MNARMRPPTSTVLLAQQSSRTQTYSQTISSRPDQRDPRSMMETRRDQHSCQAAVMTQVTATVTRRLSFIRSCSNWFRRIMISQRKSRIQAAPLRLLRVVSHLRVAAVAVAKTVERAGGRWRKRKKEDQDRDLEIEATEERTIGLMIAEGGGDCN